MSIISDEVVFETPGCAAARSLHTQLALEGSTSRSFELDTWLVVVTLDTTSDVARLLRRVERWIAREGHGALRYHLDGRAYILEAGDVRWSDVPAPAETPVSGER